VRIVSTTERDLSLLISAVCSPSGPAPELLVRYVDDPGALTEAERSEIEEAISADPLLAGELRVLQSLRLPAAPAHRFGRPAAAPGGRSAPPESRTE
jgi:hypothetical protein